MKVLATWVGIIAVTGGSATMPSAIKGVPGTVSVPLPVVVTLIFATAFAVWVMMSTRRLKGDLARSSQEQADLSQELSAYREQLANADEQKQAVMQAAQQQESVAHELQDRVRSLERIIADSARFNATRNLSDLPARITTAVAELSGFAKAVMYLWSDATGAFEARGFSGLSEASIAALAELQVTPDEFEATCGSAARYGNCFLGERAGFETKFAASAEMGVQYWTADRLLIIPLITPTGETLGYLTLDDPDTGKTPDPVGIRQIEFLAYQGAIAIESAQVYDRFARNNAELSRASEKLGSLAEMKANFVANVSHELRTPLTSISAYAELLQVRMDTMSDQERNEFLQVIHNESLKLSEIIDDILEINEMDSGRPGLVQAETNLVALARHLESSWRSRARERGIDLVVNSSSEDISLAADTTMINQMLGKLVSNAFKFNSDGGRVAISIEETGTAVKIVVEDSGIGIPDEELGRVFERFYQVDSSATRLHNGQGLGLAICHDIVNHHDGRIWAENIQPHGARFTVLLPRRPLVHQATESEPGMNLAVEPGEFMERLMHWVAESMGVQVVSLMMPAEDGDYLRIRAAIGLPESVVQSVRLRSGVGVVGKVWATGNPLLIKDLDSVEAFGLENDEIRYTTPSLLCVPLRDQDEVVGIIAVNNRIDGRSLTEDDQALLQALAPRLAQMLAGCRSLRVNAEKFEVLRNSLRTITPVGHLSGESVQDICREICLASAREINLPTDDLQHLAFTLKFYDAGMSCVPPQLLNHPGPLTEEEMVFVRRHVKAGLEILEPLLSEPKVRQLILHHHENYDGSGYPMGLVGEAIPLGSRLIRLTDTLTALLSPRPWRCAYSLDEALAEIRKGVGREFCPRMAEVFFQQTIQRRGRIEDLLELEIDGADLSRPGLDQRGMVSLPS